ncbi:hypothetical protein QQF64_001151 [Cirrhinus molitorella]|uniref:Integrase catalytic domain-containing protein n=1 Tax=Cirrhinus molitorella TaxID=172907 RepID=A0ABR3NZ71_9TELE
MATSRDFHEGEQAQDPRPSRTRRVPTYLEDYVLDYHGYGPPSPADVDTGTSHTIQAPYRDVTTPAAQDRGSESDRLHHLEARWRDLRSEMRELQIQLDSARQEPFAFRAPGYGHYKSLPHIEPSAAVVSPPQGTIYIEPLIQRLQPTVQTPNIARVASLPGPQPQRLFVEPRIAGSWPSSPAVQTSLPQVQPQQQLITVQPLPARMQPSNVQPQLQTAPVQSAPIHVQPQYQQTVPAPIQSVLAQRAMPSQQHYQPLPLPPPHRPRPQPQYYYSANPAAPGLLEMAIASSYGIPKPKLAVFSTGKESDFMMLKKGLDSILGPHRHLTEDYKYQVLLDHLKLPAAYQVAKRYVNSQFPYTRAMQALEQRYGQPRQLIQSELRAILNAPAIRPGDAQGFEDFAAAVNTLVGMLNNMDGPSRYELHCGSHVDTLLTKLPVSYRDSFIEYCLNQHIIVSGSSRTYTLPEFAEWLERKAQAIQISRRVTGSAYAEPFRREPKPFLPSKSKAATILTGSENPKAIHVLSSSPADTKIVATSKGQDRFKPFCPYLTIEDTEELRKSSFCGNVSVSSPLPPNVNNCRSWDDLILTTYQSMHGAAASSMSATERIEIERAVLERAQFESFPDEVHTLKANKPVHSNSRLRSLAPALDTTLGLIRVGGRLRKAATLPEDAIHPIVLEPEHPITKLLIQDFDDRLMHPGCERVFSELRRTYWILRGRQAVKKHQRQCVECRKWRSKPIVPKMADLPDARLRIEQPPFWSTGVDCFGPYMIKIGRRQEKRWGIIFKCLTTRCVHLDLLCSMDADSFLLALRRFIARRGKPFELICDRGTNFRGGERELIEAFTEMEPSIQEQLAKQKISFKFNPPHAPHFGGAWEREIKSVKSSLQVVLKDYTVPEEVLITVLTEVEGILNSKPLGYASVDIADLDPITPNLLLMGRRDASLPQAVYGPSNLLGRRRYRHSQVIADHFWTQFIRNYLPGLQLRQKWQNMAQNIAVGQVVLVVDSQLPRAQWPIGRVTKVLPSDDDAVRTAEVHIKGNTYIRPVAKLIVLPKMPKD